MIGDNIIIEDKYLELGNAVFQKVEKQLKHRSTISIGGESGCGKSTLAIALKKVLEQANYEVCILHMDDYFHRPPTDTHNRRLADIGSVGLEEVNLTLLATHIEQFQKGAKTIEKPLIYFQENRISTEILTFTKNTILIIEGTYVTKLPQINTKIFMTRNYQDTYKARMSRGRDQGTEFVEQVLGIEHELISPDAAIADILVDKNYQVSVCSHF